MRRILSIAKLVALLSLLLLAIQPPHPMAAQTQSSVDNFILYVNQYGFNGTSGNLTLGPVPQGDTVKITFIWNDSEVPYNTHQFEVGGYNITSGVISEQTINSVVQFTADSAGTFRIYCIIPCLGMENMLNGWLVVIPAHQSTTGTTSSSSSSGSGNVTSSTTVTTSSTSSTSSGTVTTSSTTTTRSSTISISSSSTDTTSSSSSSTGTRLNVLTADVRGGILFVSARLIDSIGNPVAGVPVHFSIPTDFGMMPIGSNVTQSNGTAYFAYKLHSTWQGDVYAYFSGSNSYNSSNVTTTVQYDPSKADSGPPYVSGQANFMDLRLVGVPPGSAEVVMWVFLLAIASVYATIAFVMIHVLGIRKRRVDVAE